MSEISTKEIGSTTVASIRKSIPVGQVGSFLSSAAISLLVYLKENGTEIVGKGFSIKHSITEECVDMEVCVPIKGKLESRDSIDCKELPAAKVAFKLHKGEYVGLKGVHEELRSWCSSNGQNFSQAREVYLKGPQETPNPDDYETEIQYVLN